MYKVLNVVDLIKELYHKNIVKFDYCMNIKTFKIIKYVNFFLYKMEINCYIMSGKKMIKKLIV